MFQPSPFLRKFFAGFTTLTMLLWSLGVPLGTLVGTFWPAGEAHAAAPTFDNTTVDWSSSSSKALIDFAQPVFNGTSTMWGPPGGLETSDFTISGTGAPSLTSIQHEGGGRYAVLEFDANLVGATTIACAANAIYDEGMGGTPAACSSTSVTLSNITEDSTGPTVASVQLWSGESLDIEFSEPVSITTAGTSTNYALNTADTADNYDAASGATPLNDATQDLADGVQDAFVWVFFDMPNVVGMDVWDANIADGDTLYITTSVTDVFGNPVASEIAQTLNFTAGGGGGATGAPEVLGVFYVDATHLDIVFSKAMEQTSLENTAFYTVTDRNATFDLADDINLPVTAAAQQANTAVVRLTVDTSGGGSLDPTDFEANMGAEPDTVRVTTSFDTNGGPKDTDGNMQMTDWDAPVEPAAAAPQVEKMWVTNSNYDINLHLSMPMDAATVATSSFTVGALAISSVELDPWGRRDIFIHLDQSGAAFSGENVTIDVTDGTGVADIFGSEIVASNGNSPCSVSGNTATCTADLTAPQITKVVHSDLDGDGTINQNDTVDIYFSENMDTNSAWSPWDFELNYGANCSLTAPTDDRTNCNWGYWGDGATLDWTNPSAGDTDARIVVGAWPDAKGGYYVVPWTDPYGFGGVQGDDGNSISNVGTISVTSGNDTANPTISSIKVQTTDSTLNAGDVVTIVFSEAMDQTTATSGIANDVLTDGGDSYTWGSNPTVSWSADGTEVSITLDTGEGAAAGYTVAPDSTVTDLAGNGVSGSKAIPGLTGPTLVTDPGGGEDVSEGNTKLHLIFDEPIANISNPYPAVTKTLPNTYEATPSAISTAYFPYGGGGSVLTIDYISGDGKEVILDMDNAVLAADSLSFNLTSLVGGVSGVASNATGTLSGFGVLVPGDGNADAVGPTISALKPMTEGMSAMDPSQISSDIVSGDRFVIEFSESVNPGSFYDLSTSTNPLDLDTALPIWESGATTSCSACTWGEGAKAKFMTGGPTDNFSTGNVEITLGVPASGKSLIKDSDVVKPTGITDYVGNAGTGSATVNTTPPELTSASYTDTGAAGVNATDTVAFTFNTAMDASIATSSLISNLDFALWAEACDMNGCTDHTWGSGASLAANWSNGNKTLTITLGSSPTIAEGDEVWFDPMYIHTVSFGNIFRPAHLDFSGPTLVSVDAFDVDGSTSVTAGDKIYFAFSEEMDQTSITSANVNTVLAGNGGEDWGATSTLAWQGPARLELTVANNPLSGATFGTTTVDPTSAVKDISGNADNTTVAPSVNKITMAPPENVTLTDNDTTYPGVDGNDISVTWTTPSVGTVHHYNAYILPSNVGFDASSQYPINSSDIASSATSFNGTSSAYMLFDDSRFDYANASAATQFYPFMPEMSYNAYVVACEDAACSVSSLPGLSPGVQLSHDFTMTGPMPTTGGAGGGMGSGLPFMEGALPFSGKIDVPLNIGFIGAMFSEPLDTSTVTSSTFKIEEDTACDGTYEGTISGSLSFAEDDHAVLFTPTASTPLTASACYQIHATTGVQSLFGTALESDQYSTFTAGTASDTSSPSIADNKFQAEGINTSSVDPTIPEIGVRFSEDMDPSSFTSSSVTLTAGTIPVSGDAEYDPFGRTLHFWLSSALIATTSYTMTLDGSLIQDIAGNTLGASCAGCTINFTTGALSSTPPQMSWADGDSFHMVVGFDSAMKESSVTDSSNWRLTDSSGVEVSLTGKSLFYDQFMQEMDIDGLSLTSGEQYTIAVRQPDNNVKGMNGVAVNANNNSLNFTVHDFMGPGVMDCADQFAFGCSMDNPLNADVMNFMPVSVWPENNMAKQTSAYFVDIPITQAIDSGGKIILEFPAAFDVSNASAAATSTAWVNNDINGPGPNTVTISNIEANKPSSGSIRITLGVDGTGSTSAKDFLTLDIAGIRNPSNEDASTVDFATGKGGYQVTISTKDSTGKTLDSNLKSIPFPIEKGGNGKIAGTVKDSAGSAVSGVKVFLDSPRGGHFESTTDAGGRFNFRSLATPSSGTIDYWLFVEPPHDQGYMGGSGFAVSLGATTTQVTNKTLTLTRGTKSISGKIVHDTSLAGEKVMVHADGPSGWTDKKVTLASATTTSYSISVTQGDWNVGVDMWMPFDMFGPMDDKFSTSFMPPPPKFVSVSDNVTGVNFSLNTLNSSTDTITGTVSDQSGNTMPDVDVWAHSDKFSDTFTQTNPDGTYTLYVPAGTYNVGVGKPGLKSPPEVQVVAPKANVDFTMKKNSAYIKGAVTDSAGSPISGAAIMAFDATTGEAWDSFTNDSGYYTVYSGAGTWTVEARHPQFGLISTSAGADSYSVTITSSSSEGNDFQVGGGGTVTFNSISGYICASNPGADCASPSKDVVVTATEIDSNGDLTGRGASVVIDADDGSYTLSVPQNTATTTYTLKAMTKHGPLKKKTGLDPATDGDLTGKNWTVKTPVKVTINIKNVPATYENDTAEIQKAVVDFLDASSGKEKTVYMKGVDGSSGTASWTTKLIPSNQYDVIASIPGFGELAPDSGSLTSSGYFKVSAGTPATIDFTLPSTTIDISGTVTDNATGAALEDAWVVVDETDGKKYQIETESDGTYTITVPSDTYSLTVGLAGYKDYTHSTDVTADATVNVALVPVGATITGTVYESDGSTFVEKGYVAAKEFNGTGNTGAEIKSGVFTLNVDAGTTWDLKAKSETGYEQATLVRAAAGDSATITLDDAIAEFSKSQSYNDSITPSSGKSIDDTKNNNVEIDARPGSLGNTGTEKSVSIESKPALHESSNTDLFGDEKEVKVGTGKESNLSNALDFSIVYDKANIDGMVSASGNGVTASNVDEKVAALEIATWDNAKGAGGDWVSDPTVKRVQVDEAGGAAIFAYEDYSTFTTNLGSNTNYYDDYKIELKTATPHMSIRGTPTGADDDTPPNIPPKPSVSGTDGVITVSWINYSPNENILEYEIYRNTSGTFSALVGTVCTSSTTATCQANANAVTAKTFNDANVTGNTDYYYVITAVDLAGNGDVIGRISSVSDAVRSDGGTPGGGGGGGAPTPAPAEEEEVVEEEVPAEEEVTPAAEAPVYKENTLIQAEGGEAVYVIKNGKKLHIPSAAAFNAAGYSWDEITIVPPADEAAVSSITLIREEGKPEVYVVKDDIKRHIPNPTALEAEGYAFSDVVDVPSEHAAGYATSNLIRADGELKVYIVEGGKKRHLPNPDVFESYGFDWSVIMTVSSAALGGYDDVTLMRAEGKEKVYKLEAGQRRWIETAEVFEGLGHNWADIVEVNDTELSTYTEGESVASYGTGGLPQWLGDFEW